MDGELELRAGGYEFLSSDLIYPDEFTLHRTSEDAGLSDVFVTSSGAVVKINAPHFYAQFPGTEGKEERYDIIDRLISIDHSRLLTPSEVYRERLKYRDGDSGWARSYQGERIVEVYDEVVINPTLASAKESLPLDSEYDLVRDLLEDVVDGVAALHNKEILHHDVRPENVFVDTDTMDATVFDVSLATEPYEWGGRELQHGGLARPPEHIDGGHIDEQYDVWRIGAMWLVLTHNNLPDYALSKIRDVTSPHQSVIDFPPEDRQIIAQALDPDREKRFEDCQEMLEAF